MREAYEFTRSLVASGHHVDLYVPSTSDGDFLPFHLMVAEHYQYDLKLHLPLRRRLPGFRKYVDLAKFYRNIGMLDSLAHKMATDIDSRSYDFVFAHHDRIIQSPYLFRYLNTPSVYYCAEPMRMFYEPESHRPYHETQTAAERVQQLWYSPARWIQNEVTKREDRRNISQATLLLTNSYYSAESIFKAYGLRSRVVYLGVDTEKFRPLGQPRGDFVLSVGAVSPYKGYDFLIKTLGHVPVECRPRFIIVGNTASTGEAQFLHDLALENSVDMEVRVNITDEELVDLYSRASVFVYAPVMEPFGLAPIEAMSCGTPVIAVKEGGPRESVIDGQTGFLVDRVPDEFASCLCRLLQDSILRKELGENGVNYVREFWSWTRASQRLIDVVDQLIST